MWNIEQYTALYVSLITYSQSKEQRAMSEIKELPRKLDKINLDLLMIRLDTEGEKLERLKAASVFIDTAEEISGNIKE